MINKGEILTLDDNKKYIVVSSRLVDNVNYVYLIDGNDYNNFMFCKFDNNNGLEEISEVNLLSRLMIEFKKDIDAWH